MNIGIEKAISWLALDLNFDRWQGLKKGKASHIIKHSIGQVPVEVDQDIGTIVFGQKGERHWLHALLFLSSHFLCWRRGGLAVKDDPEVVLELQQVLSRLPLEPVLAFAWVVDVERASLGDINEMPLRRLGKSRLEALYHSEPLIPTPDWYELDMLRKRGLEEPHRHLQGSVLMPLYWLDILRGGAQAMLRQRQYNLAREIAAIRRLRRVLKARMEHGSWQWDEHFEIGQFWDGLFQNRVLLSDSDCILPRDLEVSSNNKHGNHDHDLIIERRFLVGLIETAIHNGHDPWLNLFSHAYIAWSARIWRRLIQDRDGEVGFGRFDKKHSDDLRYVGYGHIRRKIVQSRRTGYVSHVAWRVTPKALFETANELGKAEGRGPLGNMPRVGHCLSKTHHKDERQDALICHWIRRKGYREREHARMKGAAQFRVFLGSRNAARLEGIDIANSEFNGWNAEFAALFHRVKHCFLNEEFLIPRPFEGPQHLKTLPHAGEDFRHILSGMRAMDETWRFLDMATGDRIGHGLAMGLEPALWFEQVGRDIAMPRGEWVDNLVWFRRQAKAFPEFSHILHQLDDMIHELAGEIYDHYIGGRVKLHDLEQAQMMRRLPYREVSASASFYVYPAMQRIKCSDEVKKVWRIDIAALKTQQMKRWRIAVPEREAVMRRNEIILTHTPGEWDEVIRAIQDRWIKEFSEKGCLIEANPSSNLCISVLKELDEHPIFRWVPLDGPPKARVMVGSDDPGVFATELIFEYAALLAVVKKNSQTLFDGEAWLNKLVLKST